MKKLFIYFFLLLQWHLAEAQNKTIPTPDQVYGELFTDVQLSGVFPDSKTFVDAIPKKDPRLIVKEYLAIKNNPAIRFSIKMFVEENFILPSGSSSEYVSNEKDIREHIRRLWKVLRREPDKTVPGSSLLPLPYPYIVPGGRFREIYYWDSYFTMLGLKESGETEMIHNMVRNFSFLINTYGHIPNGNRSYYLSRSQPPYFSKMVELLAGIKGNDIYRSFLPALVKEYNYWMKGSASLKPGAMHRSVVKLKDGTILNRYWDDRNIPRQESYREDVETANAAIEYFIMVATFIDASHQKRVTDSLRKTIYRHLRAGATSGLDFSSRWFEDQENLRTIHTTDILAVDLNALLYHLETTIAHAYKLQKNQAKSSQYAQLAARRKRAIEKYFWSPGHGFYVDYDFRMQQQTDALTLNGMTPFFFGIADKSRITAASALLKKEFLKDGGLVTSLRNTGQQWDAPNGWPPLQWISIMGLENYGEKELAGEIARRWIRLNKTVFNNTGRLMEKYNVVNTSLEAGGGEYPGQDGFGWTNGVLLALMAKYEKGERE